MQALPALPSRLTHMEADAFVGLCRDRLRGQSGLGVVQVWSVDASALDVFDSSALAALLAVTRLVHEQGGHLHWHGMPSRLRELATLYGVSELLPT